jgi:putative FmdB family regulatory protein
MLMRAMPIYEYRRADGTTFELLQKFTDEALTVDPQTGEPVQRVFHAPAIHFKGKGFHNTDYGTRRRNRELEKSGESGADGHADKSRQGRREGRRRASGSGGLDASDGSSSDGASSPSRTPSPRRRRPRRPPSAEGRGPGARRAGCRDGTPKPFAFRTVVVGRMAR